MEKTPRLIIPIRAEAPTKPSWGQACNGCGVCCLTEPCPVGMLLSRRTQGACVAVLWDEAQQHYQCGMVTQPQVWCKLPWRWSRRVMSWLSRRWIAAGRGCDCDIELVSSDEDAGK